MKRLETELQNSENKESSKNNFANKVYSSLKACKKVLLPVVVGAGMFVIGTQVPKCGEKVRVIQKIPQKQHIKISQNNKVPYKSKVRINDDKYPVKRQSSEIDFSVNSKFFIFNYWKDLNKNDIVNYPAELIGIKNEFRKGEKITFGSQIENRTGGDLIGEIYDWNENLVGKFNKKVKFDKCFNYVTYDVADLMTNNGGGTYKVKWYLNNKFIGGKRFDLIE